MYHPDELRDEHGRWSASGLLRHGIKLRSAGRVHGRPAQAVMHNGTRIGHVESHGNGRFSAHVGDQRGMANDAHHSSDHESISAAAAHVAAHHLNRQEGLPQPGASNAGAQRAAREGRGPLTGGRAKRPPVRSGRGGLYRALGGSVSRGPESSQPAPKSHKAARHHIGAAQNFLENAMTSAEGQPIVGGGWEPGRPEQVPGELRGAVSHIQRARSVLPTQHPAHPHLRAAENHASTAINMQNPVGYIGAAQRSLNHAHSKLGADQPNQDEALHREMDSIDREVAQGNRGAALDALRSGRLEAAARQDRSARRAANKARVRGAMDAEGFMHIDENRGLRGKLKRGNTVRVKGHKGPRIIVKRSGDQITHRDAAAGLGQRHHGSDRTSPVVHVTHVRMSRSYGRP